MAVGEIEGSGVGDFVGVALELGVGELLGVGLALGEDDGRELDGDVGGVEGKVTRFAAGGCVRPPPPPHPTMTILAIMQRLTAATSSRSGYRTIINAPTTSADRAPHGPLGNHILFYALLTMRTLISVWIP